MKAQGFGYTFYGLLLVMAALAVAAPTLGTVATVVLIMLLVYAALAYSINFITGMTGYVAFGHVLFMAIGSYSLAVVVTYYGVSPFLGVGVGALLGLLFAGAIGPVILKFRGVYFAIASLVLALAGYDIVLQFPIFGPGGELILSLTFQPLTVYYTIWALVLVEILVTYFLNRGRLGFGVRAIKSEEEAAAALGVDSRKLKLYVFMLSGLFAGAAGSVFAWFTFGVTSVQAFNLYFSLQMLAMIIIGGMGTSIGPLLGATIVYIPTYEFLNRMGGGWSAVIIGLLVMVVALFVPDGIVGGLRKRNERIRTVLE